MRLSTDNAYRHYRRCRCWVALLAGAVAVVTAVPASQAASFTVRSKAPQSRPAAYLELLRQRGFEFEVGPDRVINLGTAVETADALEEDYTGRHCVQCHADMF